MILLNIDKDQKFYLSTNLCRNQRKHPKRETETRRKVAAKENIGRALRGQY